MDGLIGQERAATATAFGVGMRHAGYNLFVLGPARTGKTSSMKRVLARAAEREPVPPDYCYVHNFADPYRPTALEVPAGRGRGLREQMRRLAEECRTRLPRAFESEEFEQQKAQHPGGPGPAPAGGDEPPGGGRPGPAVRGAPHPGRDGPGARAPRRAAEPVGVRGASRVRRSRRCSARSAAVEQQMETSLRRIRQLEREARRRPRAAGPRGGGGGGRGRCSRSSGRSSPGCPTSSAI